MKKKNNAHIEDIKNYESEFRQLNSYVEAVRLRPGMHIGPLNNKGLLNMAREIFQNSGDEVAKGFCDTIIMSFDERTHEIIIEDNGRGIPHNIMIDVYTNPYISTNYEKKPGQYSSGMNGVGAKVTNALSSEFTVESYVLGEGKTVTFKDYIPTTKEPQDIKNPKKAQGTIVRFKPYYPTLGEITLKGMELLSLFRKIVSFLTIGTKFIFSWIDINGNTHQEIFINEDGILTSMIDMVSSPLISPIVCFGDTGHYKAEIAFTYDSNDLNNYEEIIAFSNYCPTVGGPHIDGFMNGVTKFFRNYMNKVYLNKKSKLVIINNDIRVGLKAVINAASLNPNFTGQAKEILDHDPEMAKFMANLVHSNLEEWSKTNPNDLQKITKYIKDIAEIRVKSEEGKVKLSNQYKTSVLSNLPAKYVKPTEPYHNELVIVEGDSALAPARSGRCPKRQGLFPIRGKLPNALTTTKTKFLNNSEIAGIISIIGGGYGRSFDISKVKWEKIIWMTDADIDGAHIRTLGLKFMMAYMPELIAAGKVYTAVPPLYGIKTGKNKYNYFTDKKDYTIYSQKKFSKANDLATLENKPFTSNEVVDLLYRNFDYVYELDVLSNTYALDPGFVELVLLYLNSSFSKLKKVIESTYRFVTVEKTNSVVVINGLINKRRQMLFINDKFLKDCDVVLNYINRVNNGQIIYKLNNSSTSIYTIMKVFESSASNTIQRYKGLGEMNVDQLSISTLHPDKDRTLHQYTLEDIKTDMNTIRYIESNKHQLMADCNININLRDLN